jgi:hypothetical protein
MIMAWFTARQMLSDSPFLIERQTCRWDDDDGDSSGGRLQECRGDRYRALPGTGGEIDDNCC